MRLRVLSAQPKKVVNHRLCERRQQSGSIGGARERDRARVRSPQKHSGWSQNFLRFSDGKKQAGSLPLCLASLFQHKLPDFVVLRLTGFVFLLLLSSLLQKHKTCRPQSNKIKQFVLEKGREAEGRGAGLIVIFISVENFMVISAHFLVNFGKYFLEALMKRLRKVGTED